MTERKFINVPIIGTLISDNSIVNAVIIERIITDGKKDFLALLKDGRRLYCDLPGKDNHYRFIIHDEMAL